MWRYCRKRAPAPELEVPSSPLSCSSGPSSPSPTLNQTPHRINSPSQTIIVEAPESPTTNRVTRKRKCSPTNDEDVQPQMNTSHTPNEAAASPAITCHRCKTLATCVWRKAVIDGERMTVCNACSCLLWRIRKKSEASQKDSAKEEEEAVVDDEGPALPVAKITELPDEIPLVVQQTSSVLVRRPRQQKPRSLSARPKMVDERSPSGMGWQLSRPQKADWLTLCSETRSFRAGSHRTDTIKPGEDLQALAKSLAALSQLLDRVGKECDIGQIGWLEQYLEHGWRVEEMAIFVHGFLSGIATKGRKTRGALMSHPS